MFNRIILAAVMLAISTAGSAAKDEPTKEECPTLDHQEIEDLLRKAPSCQRAGALFEICQFGASGARLRRSAAPIWHAIGALSRAFVTSSLRNGGAVTQG